MRHTRSATRQRRSHHGLEAPVFSKCSHCGKGVLPHMVCPNCGYYKGRQVIDVLAKLDKKARKKKEKELHAHEEGQAEKRAEKGETLSAEGLSHR